MLLLNESFRGRDPDLRIRSVVAVKCLHRPSQRSAGLIDTLKRELHAILFTLSAVGVLSAEYCGDADANRLRRDDWTEAQQTSGQKNSPESHRFVPVNGGLSSPPAGSGQAVSFRLGRQSSPATVTRS